MRQNHPDRLRRMSDLELGRLSFEWDLNARPSQMPPPGDWSGWLILAGRGWGKTRVGAEFLRAEVESGRAKRVALVAETSADGRNVMVEGDSGILACSATWNRPVYEPHGGA